MTKDQNKAEQAELKRQKVEPTEVSMIDVLIELRSLRNEVKQLKIRLDEHITYDPNARIG